MRRGGTPRRLRCPLRTSGVRGPRVSLSCLVAPRAGAESPRRTAVVGKRFPAQPASPTKDPPRPRPGRSPGGTAAENARRCAPAAGAAPAGFRGPRTATRHRPERPGRASEGPRLAPAAATDPLRRVCSAEFAGEGRAGGRGAATGCGATSRGASQEVRLPGGRVAAAGVALVPPVRAIHFLS